MAVITATSGTSMTLVESNSPPSPTSSTTISHFLSRKYCMAMAVISSNSVGVSSMASAKGRIFSTIAASSSSVIISPSTCIRSLKLMIYGEVYRPVRYPALRRTEAMDAAVEPLPLVPAMWANFSFFSGLPRAFNSSRVRDRPGLCQVHFSDSIYANVSSFYSVVFARALSIASKTVFRN